MGWQIFRSLNCANDSTTVLVQSCGTDADIEGDSNMDNFGDGDLKGVDANFRRPCCLALDSDVLPVAGFHAQRFVALSLLALTTSLAGCGVFSGKSSSERNALNETDVSENKPVEKTDRGFSRNLYAAAGLGASYLEPDTSERADVRVTEKVDNGAQIALGVDISKQLSLELHATDLGSAELSNGEIDYSMKSGSALIYMGKNRKRYKRQGLTGYGRLGYGTMDNSSSGSVEYENVNSSHILVGAGLEYMSRIGLGVRGEFISFDRDARFLQLGLIYRLGLQRSSQNKAFAESASGSVAAGLNDNDRDGVSNNADSCPTTASDLIVNVDGCALLSGAVDGVNFLSNSGELTESAKGILDDVVQSLSGHPDALVKIMAHTDSQGPASYNQNLSEVRAKSVARYLWKQGIEIRNMAARAFGESKPLDTNDTVEGRKRNRRVEIYATKPVK